jgi:hypothetical protein
MFVLKSLKSMFYMFFFLNSVVRSIDWSDAFTQFKSFRLGGAYPPSKAFQVLSTYKLKQDLLNSLFECFVFISVFYSNLCLYSGRY